MKKHQEHKRTSFFSPNYHLDQYIWSFFAILLALTLSFGLFPTSTSHGNTDTTEQIIELINRERSAYNLSILEPNPLLEKAAKAKAQDILKNDYFAHTSPDGITPWSFIKSVGVDYVFAGENLAIGYTNATELHHDLLASDSHRANILSPEFSEVGVAIMQGIYKDQPAVITVQLFSKPPAELAKQ